MVWLQLHFSFYHLFLHAVVSLNLDLLCLCPGSPLVHMLSIIA